MPGARLFTHPALARKRFRELVEVPDTSIDLAETALVIAQEDSPRITVAEYLQTLDTWTEAIRDRIVGSSDVERVIDSINRFLFEQEGFHGEDDDYYDPRSILLSEVLDRHAGSPITLSIVYIEISRRLGVLSVAGVSLPGRFLVKVTGTFGEILLDPYDGGRVLSTSECQAIMDRLYGGGVRLREHHLRAISKREILSRLLAQMKAGYLARHELEKAAAAIDRLLILDEKDAYEIRDRGILALQMHSYRDAMEFLGQYLRLVPHAEDRHAVRERIDWLQAWLDQN